MHRVQVLSGHLSTNNRVGMRQSSASAAAPNDIAVVHGLRTAISRAKRGSFKLLSAVMSAVLKDVGLRPSLLGDVCVVDLLQRMGAVRITIVQNVESMSLRSPNNPGDLSPRLMDDEKTRDCIIPMGITSENVAERFGITREAPDRSEVAMAQKKGLFDQEITPVTTKFVDENGTERTITVTKDDGIRPGTTFEGLAKLRPTFKETGSTTAGVHIQVSNGAAAVLIGWRSTVEKLGLPVFGVLRASAVVGVPLDVMGIGPAYAIPEALNQAGLTVDDIDVFEINEAFASQAVYCVEKLGIPMEKVNPNGGAIALGHPLGCTGCCVLCCRGYGVVSMCIGTGMGAAAVFEYPGQC
uniref:Acetyl-CoA acyltransferase 1 n=1 Tax=Cyprinus carpio TaxID=7962 RepID=A0A8C2BL11_CYPCA